MQDIFNLLIFSDLVVTLELNFVIFANKPKVYRFKAFWGCFGLGGFFFFFFFFLHIMVLPQHGEGPKAFAGL